MTKNISRRTEKARGGRGVGVGLEEEERRKRKQLLKRKYSWVPRRVNHPVLPGLKEQVEVTLSAVRPQERD